MATPTGGFYLSKLAYTDEDGKGIYYREGAFNSDETKPLAATMGDLASGSIIVEPDTGTVYIYDRPGDQWVAQFSLQE